MTSKEPFQQPSDDRDTFTITTSTKNKILAKLIITTGLIAFTSYWAFQSSTCRYEKGRGLTQ
jgi:hypothetical protein